MAATSHPVAGGARTPIAGAWAAGGVVAVVALAANLATFVVARLWGVDMSVRPPGGEEMVVGPGTITAMTVVPVLLGSVLLRTLRERGAVAWRVLGWVGLAVGVLTASAPFSVEAGSGTRVALACMHVVTGVVWVLVVHAALRRSARRMA